MRKRIAKICWEVSYTVLRILMKLTGFSYAKHTKLHCIKTVLFHGHMHCNENTHGNFSNPAQ